MWSLPPKSGSEKKEFLLLWLEMHHICNGAQAAVHTCVRGRPPPPTAGIQMVNVFVSAILHASP